MDSEKKHKWFYGGPATGKTFEAKKLSTDYKNPVFQPIRELIASEKRPLPDLLIFDGVTQNDLAFIEAHLSDHLSGKMLLFTKGQEPLYISPDLIFISQTPMKFSCAWYQTLFEFKEFKGQNWRTDEVS